MGRWGPVLRCAATVAFFIAAHGAIAGQVGAGGATVVREQTHGDVSLKVGALLEVRLEANHTTGVSWVAAPVADPVLVRQGRAAYQEHVAGSTGGAGGVEGWRVLGMGGG